MRKPRIYHPHPLTTTTTVSLTANASAHIARVLRLKKGAELILFNGHGGEFDAVIDDVEKHQVYATITHYHDINRESPLYLHLGQGISRGEKMDYTIQKAVELGVQEITPLFTERSEVRLDKERSAKRLRHWEAIIISACEQSGRTHIPIIHEPCELKVWLALQTESLKLMFHPIATMTLHQLTPAKSIRVVIGPEGGFSDKEITFATTENFSVLQLGPRVLRTETAAVAALCALQCHWGDLSLNNPL
ncbi:16S rRNA (uracil(1498)-N(3))-methyltransferase [soil metagenome]